jgi:hypothetical protein
MNISESFQQIIPQMMNDTLDNWLFAFNCVVPNLTSNTLSVNDSDQFYPSYSVPDIKLQKTKFVVAGSLYRVGGAGLGYGLDIQGNMFGFPAGKKHVSLFKRFQIECGTTQPPVGVKGFFPESKWPGAWE